MEILEKYIIKNLFETECRYVINLFHIRMFKINVVKNIKNGLNINKDHNNIAVKMLWILKIG